MTAHIRVSGALVCLQAKVVCLWAKVVCLGAKVAWRVMTAHPATPLLVAC